MVSGLEKDRLREELAGVMQEAAMNPTNRDTNEGDNLHNGSVRLFRASLDKEKVRAGLLGEMLDNL